MTREASERLPDTPWASIAGLRNVVVHEYFRVQRELVEDIVTHHLEPLAEAIRQHLEQSR